MSQEPQSGSPGGPPADPYPAEPAPVPLQAMQFPPGHPPPPGPVQGRPATAYPVPGYGQVAQPGPGYPPAPAVPGYPSAAQPVPGYPWPGYLPPSYPPAGYLPPTHPATVGLVQRVEVLPGTSFGLLYPPTAATVSGPAVGSLVAGLGALVVCAAELLFGAYAANYDAGPLVAGAFLILALLLGGGAAVIGGIAGRQIRRSAAALRGRGVAISGVVVGSCGAALSVVVFLIVAVASATASGQV